MEGKCPTLEEMRTHAKTSRNDMYLCAREATTIRKRRSEKEERGALLNRELRVDTTKYACKAPALHQLVSSLPTGYSHSPGFLFLQNRHFGFNTTKYACRVPALHQLVSSLPTGYSHSPGFLFLQNRHFGFWQ